jgi:hypothetical protein
MNRLRLTLPVLAIIFLFSCNDTPNVQPVNAALNIYPNPVSTSATVSIHVPTNQSFLFRMFDTKGKIVYEQQNVGDQVYSIDMSTRPTGTYNIIFSTGSLSLTQKLIKL